MVLGEPQILGQMKQAVREADAAGTLGPATVRGGRFVAAASLDERVEAHRRFVEDEQVRPVLERHDKPDLLLVALAVLLELAAGVQVQALDEAVDVGPVHPAPQVAEVGDRLGAGQAVV